MIEVQHLKAYNFSNMSLKEGENRIVTEDLKTLGEKYKIFVMDVFKIPEQGSIREEFEERFSTQYSLRELIYHTNEALSLLNEFSKLILTRKYGLEIGLDPLSITNFVNYFKDTSEAKAKKRIRFSIAKLRLPEKIAPLESFVFKEGRRT